MQYQDNGHKWVVVLNRKVPTPQLINAVGHLALSMVRHSCQEEANYFHRYEGMDGTLRAELSHWPFVVLQAKNGNQLRTLREAALAAGLPCQDFTSAMLGNSASDQLARTNTTHEEDLEYFAVLLFGSAERLDPLTRKFSLFRAESQLLLATAE